MSKYTPLGDFLRSRRSNEVPMTFAEIERLTRVRLPPSARYRAWWSNNPHNSVMTKVWLAAGFESGQVDMNARKLVFRRVRSRPPQDLQTRGTPRRGGGNGSGQNRHPLFGLLKGLMRIPRDAQLTKPADPQWGKTR